MSAAWPAWAPHLFKGRSGGCSVAPYSSLNVGSAVGDAPERVAHNRALAAQQLGVGSADLHFVQQVHGVAIATVGHAPLEGPPAADILLTALPGVGLGLYTADCAPILLAHPRAVAAAHGGWRGAAGSIATVAVEALLRSVGGDPADIYASIGPTIGPCCYRVGKDVAHALLATNSFASAAISTEGSDQYGVDLAALHHLHLRAAGVPEARIARHGACTCCDSRYFSHRRDGIPTGRQASAICRLA